MSLTSRECVCLCCVLHACDQEEIEAQKLQLQTQQVKWEEELDELNRERIKEEEEMKRKEEELLQELDDLQRHTQELHLTAEARKAELYEKLQELDHHNFKTKQVIVA